jgi:XTP/dITP diphosphohydrolase
MELLFATSNTHKAAEAAAILKKFGITVNHFRLDHRELRSDSLEEIAREAAEAAYAACGRPVFVEDSGLFIRALQGFPGSYSAWVHGKLGNEGILRLMKGAADRAAHFEACIAFHDGSMVSVFHGACPGSIAPEARGAAGFGYDPIFIPEGEKQTFAERIALKNNLSHRYKALLEFSTALASMR